MYNAMSRSFQNTKCIVVTSALWSFKTLHLNSVYVHVSLHMCYFFVNIHKPSAEMLIASIFLSHLSLNLMQGIYEQ